MKTRINYEEASKNLDLLCQQVIASNDSIIIERQEGKSVALISASELESIMETLYLLRSPANAIRLLTSLEEAKTNDTEPQTLEDLCLELGIDAKEIYKDK